MMGGKMIKTKKESAALLRDAATGKGGQVWLNGTNFGGWGIDVVLIVLRD